MYNVQCTHRLAQSALFTDITQLTKLLDSPPALCIMYNVDYASYIAQLGFDLACCPFIHAKAH